MEKTGHDVVAVIQARSTSTRLPGKVLRELPFGSGITVLEQVVRRIKAAKRVTGIVIATTTNSDDEAILEIAGKEGVGCFRGSEEDVLSRYYHAVGGLSPDMVVRITSDCPCIDPRVVDLVVEAQLSGGADYTSNTLARTYPHGLDTEVFSFGALKAAFENATEHAEREHVTPYLYRSGRFNVLQCEAPEGARRPEIRITLDTPEDYVLLCAVYDYLYPTNPLFGVEDVVGLFDEKPWLKLINERVLQKKIHASIEGEMREAARLLDLQELSRARDVILREVERP